jgi:glycosyltransferase involved in cell wall biosynthesis
MTLLDKTNTLVIVPAYNEQDSIVSVIEEIKTAGFPFVVIDDGSTDETRNRAIGAGARTISLPFNAGVGGSLKCGFQYAVKHGYEAVIQCDADGQHPGDQIQSLVDEANRMSSNLVVGTRYLNVGTQMELSLIRRAAMHFLARIASKITNTAVSDTTSGFRLISGPLLEEFSASFPNYYLGDTFESLVVALRRGHLYSEIGVKMKNREFGDSTASTIHAISSITKVLFIVLIGKRNVNKRSNKS